MKKFLLLSALAIICSCGNEKETSTKGDEKVNVENSQEAPKSKWEYSESEDKMGDGSKYATLKSNDILDFDFPYDGGVESSITIRKTGKVVDLMYQVTKGQIIAANSVTGGSVRVKFDDEKPFETNVIGPSDHSTETIFFQSSKKIVDKIKSSKKMVIEVEFFNEGNRQIEFDVTGLEWE
ncbi:hypothetical protein PG326_00605 [Riemerella anatipestifer]|nr:hypothetical protein [Riemerella anatipestifer]MDY3356835.1 hypothetical protein [Riemerella anatipestifer]